eukprot:752470-Hanusia_phi.AAC.5
MSVTNVWGEDSKDCVSEIIQWPFYGLRKTKLMVVQISTTMLFGVGFNNGVNYDPFNPLDKHDENKDRKAANRIAGLVTKVRNEAMFRPWQIDLWSGQESERMLSKPEVPVDGVVRCSVSSRSGPLQPESFCVSICLRICQLRQCPQYQSLASLSVLLLISASCKHAMSKSSQTSEIRSTHIGVYLGVDGYGETLVVSPDKQDRKSSPYLAVLKLIAREPLHLSKTITLAT